MTQSWVIGAGGLLGTAITGALSHQGRTVYRYAEAFEWHDRERISAQMDSAVTDFLGRLDAGERWEIYWAAGVGAMGSTQADLVAETRTLDAFLSRLREQLAIRRAPGAIAFASSAGALYAGCGDFEITEASTITPQTDYAKAKLTQEERLRDFVSSVPDVRLLVARLSTLYGPGQAFGKRQGLLSHMVRCALRNRPVEIFVPLDTSRDYLFSGDAAHDLIASLDCLHADDSVARIRILAAEQSVTIAEIVGTLGRLIKKRLRIVCNRNSLSGLYATRISYRSRFRLPRDEGYQRHTLVEGMAILLQAERAAYLASTHKE